MKSSAQGTGAYSPRRASAADCTPYRFGRRSSHQVARLIAAISAALVPSRTSAGRIHHERHFTVSDPELRRNAPFGKAHTQIHYSTPAAWPMCSGILSRDSQLRSFRCAEPRIGRHTIDRICRMVLPRLLRDCITGLDPCWRWLNKVSLLPEAGAHRFVDHGLSFPATSIRRYLL